MRSVEQAFIRKIALAGAVFLAIGILWYSVFGGSFNSELENTKSFPEAPAISNAFDAPTNTSLQNEPLQIAPPNSKLDVEIAGQVVEFSLREIELIRFGLPDKEATYLYEKLSEKALGGDIIASRLLGDFLLRCQETYESVEDHNISLKRLREEGKYPSTNPVFSNITVNKDIIAEVEKQFISEFNSCKGLSLEQKQESFQWSKIASDGGDFLGLEALLKDSSITGDERLALLEKQWDDFGYLDGLNGLATVLSGLSKIPEFEGIEPNPKKAYAYFLVASKVNLAIKSVSQPFSANTLEFEYDQFESILTSRLTVQEHLEAEQLAIDIIKSNPNCCAVDSRPTVSFQE